MDIKYQEMHIQFIQDLLYELFDDGEFTIVAKNSDNWEFPLDEKILEKDPLILNIKGWTLDQSYFDENGLFVRTAFGDEENSKTFKYDEIYQLADFTGRVIYQKSFNFAIRPIAKRKMNIKESPTGETEGMRYSMKILMEKNEDLFGKGRRKND